MAWFILSFMPWFVSWFGGDTQVALPPLIPNDVQNNGLPIDSLVSSYVPALLPADQVVPPVRDCVSGVTRTISLDLDIVNRCIAPDGFTRDAVLVGLPGMEPTLPGPIISACKGDRFHITVHNKLEDASMFTGTTVHWHGIHQINSNQMDGAADVTQCPISQGGSFVYDFTANEQVGTFWYHSHYAVQYCDGLRGALIIRDPDDPYKDMYNYIDDDSTVITLMDWYHYPSPETPRQIVPDSVLIDGKGCYEAGNNCPARRVYEVEKGQNYRFRVLNMACKPYYDFSIDSHTMIVIEVDGEYVEPYEVDSIRIHAAQRYSFVLKADDPDKVGNYWIRATPKLVGSNVKYAAILNYRGAPETPGPMPDITPKKPLNETLLRSLNKLPSRLLQPEPDERINVVFSKDLFTDYNFRINGVQYKPPSVPVLLQIMKGTLAQDIDPKESIYLIPRNKVIEVTFHVDGTPGRPHPFHMHGHHFAVIKSADSDSKTPSDRPVVRDTVSTGLDDKSDGVTIRFITDNPGPWILHCHNEWHLYSGMAIVFVEDIESIRKGMPDDPKQLACPYDNPSETFTLPPPRTTEGTHSPTATPTCSPISNRRRVQVFQ